MNLFLKIWLESKQTTYLFSQFIFICIFSGLIKIQRELLHLHRTYNILSARKGDCDRSLAVVKKELSGLRHKFHIDSAYVQYDLEGLDLLERAFTLTKNGETVAVVSKKLFSLNDSYGVEISGGEDHAFILALAIILGQVLYVKANNYYSV